MALDCFHHPFLLELKSLVLRLNNVLFRGANAFLSLLVKLIDTLGSHTLSGVGHLISGIFCGRVFLRIAALLCFILCLGISRFHTLRSNSSLINGLNCSFDRISGFNLRHTKPPFQEYSTSFGNELLSILSTYSRIIKGKFLTLRNIFCKGFFCFCIDKIIIAITLCTICHSLKYRHDFIFRLLGQRIKMNGLVLFIKTLGLIAFQRTKHLAAFDVVSVNDQVIAIFLYIRHTQIAVFFFKISLEVKVRIVLCLHDRIIELCSINSDPSYHILILQIQFSILCKNILTLADRRIPRSRLTFGILFHHFGNLFKGFCLFLHLCIMTIDMKTAKSRRTKQAHGGSQTNLFLIFLQIIFHRLFLSSFLPCFLGMVIHQQGVSFSVYNHSVFGAYEAPCNILDI